MGRTEISRRTLLVGSAASLAAAAGTSLIACTGRQHAAPTATTGANGETDLPGTAQPDRVVQSDRPSDALADFDASALAELVRWRQVSPLELLDAAVARAEAMAPHLNAVVHPNFEIARRRAEMVDLGAAFAGVPFLLKDLGAEIRGDANTMGNRALQAAGYRSDVTSLIGERFLASGLVPMGRTNVPEGGLQATTQPLAYGPTLNPWDLACSTSGSSGGSAAAVAAGIVPMAHGSDGAGSIRVPAAWCGVVGLKPTRGRTPFLIHDDRRIVEFALTRTVRDSAQLLDEVQGSASGDRFAVRPPVQRYRHEVGANLERLRVALCTRATHLSIAPVVAEAVTAVGRVLDDSGHLVTADVEPLHLSSQLDPSTITTGVVRVASVLRSSIESRLGRTIIEADVEPLLWHLTTAVPVGDDAYPRAAAAEQAWSDRVVRWWDEASFDLLVLPTVVSPPRPLSDFTPDPADPLAPLTAAGTLMGLTSPFNVTGEPAISLPLAETTRGLPIGIQLVAPHGREDLLIRVASQLEEAMPWKGRRPSTNAW